MLVVLRNWQGKFLARIMKSNRQVELVINLYGFLMDLLVIFAPMYRSCSEVYVHKTAIKKWDTCAGDAILRAVDGAMLDFDGIPLK